MKTLLFAIIIFTSIFNYSFSQSDADKIRQELAPMLGQNNVGTDFWFAFPEVFYKQEYYEEILRIQVTSELNNTVKLEMSSESIEEIKTINANSNVVFELNIMDIAKYSYKENEEKHKCRVRKNSAIHITSEKPVTVQLLNSTIGFKSSSIVLPSNLLGENYIAQTAEMLERGQSERQTNPPFLNICSPYDNNIVEFKIAKYKNEIITLIDEQGNQYHSEETIVKTLNKGDTWYITSTDTIGFINGSEIESTKPIAVSYSHLGLNRAYEIQTTLYPLSNFGKEFVIPTLKIHKENGNVRITALEDNTSIYRNGKLWKSIGNIKENSFFDSYLWPEHIGDNTIEKPTPTVLTSNKPISVMYLVDTYKEFKIDTTYEMYENRSVLVIPPFKNFPNSSNFSSVKYEEFHFIDPIRNMLEIIYQESIDDIQICIMDSVKMDCEWSVLSKYLDNIEIIEYEYGNYKSVSFDIPYNSTIRLKSINSKFNSYHYRSSYFSFVKLGVTFQNDFYCTPTSIKLNDLTSNDTKVPFVTLTNYQDVSKVNGIVYDGLENSSKLAQLYMLEEYSNNFDFEIISADNGFLPDPNGNSFIPGEPVQLEFILTKRNPNLDAFAVVYACDKAGNDTLIFVNEGIFTSVSTEQTLSEYMTVTESIIQILPSALADGFTELSIFNIEGSKELNTNIKYQNSVSISNLKSGTYIITLKSESRLLTRKINVVK